MLRKIGNVVGMCDRTTLNLGPSIGRIILSKLRLPILSKYFKSAIRRKDEPDKNEQKYVMNIHCNKVMRRETEDIQQ